MLVYARNDYVSPINVWCAGVLCTDESCEAPDEGEGAEARGEELEAAHLHDGGGGDGAPGREEGAEHDGDDDEAPVRSTEGHGQRSNTSNPCRQ